MNSRRARPVRVESLLLMCAASLIVAACGGGTDKPQDAAGDFNVGAGGRLSALSADAGRRELDAACEPTLQNDFVDNNTWNNRRLLPGDCSVLEVNAPLFSWRQPYDRDLTKPWTLTLRRATGELVESATVASPRLQLRKALEPGDYTWTVSYKRDRGDRETISSLPRRFIVPTGASDVVPPTGATLAAQAASKVRPRVLPAGATFSGIVSKAKGGAYAQRYKALMREADAVLSDPIPVEPPVPDVSPSSKAYKKWKRDIANVVRIERKNINILGFAWRFTSDSRYRDAGKARLLALAGWSLTGGSSDAVNDLVNGDVFVALSRGLDLFDGSLSDSQRKTISAMVKARIEPAIAKFAALDPDPYDSHDVELVREVVNALLTAVGTFPEAEGWLAYSWDVYTSTLATWGADDGSWGNGNGYGWNMLDGFGEVIANVRLISGVDLTRNSWVRRVGDILIASTAPAGTHMSAFGDAAEATDNYALYAKDQFRLYAALTRQPNHEWYWRVGDASTSENAVISPYHFMLLGLNLPETQPAAPTNPSALFEEAGVVAMHDDPSATGRSSVFFRSSRFGSYNHSFADQNAFALVSKGRDVLISGGYYPYYLSPHHATVTRATRYKNALTFDGGIGQAEPVKSPTAPGKPVQSMDTRGELIGYQARGNWTSATGNAVLAYRGWDSSKSVWRPLLSNAIRSIAYNRLERVVVIYDWATSDTARNWELNFNALEAFSANGKSAKATNQTSSACIDVYGVSGAFSTSSGFVVPPEGTYPNQYQARFRTTAASGALVAVTVIRESCRVVPVSVSTQGTMATVSINGGPSLTFNGRNATIP